VPTADETAWEYNQWWASLAQSQGLWYDPQDEENDGELWTSNMPEYGEKSYPSSAPLNWAN